MHRLTTLVMLTLANIRKNKGQAASLFFFVLVAAMLLNLGLLMLLDFGKSFDRRVAELDAPHFAVLELESLYDERQLAWLEDYPGVTEVAEEDTYSIMADFSYNGGTMPAVLLFSDADKAARADGLALMEGEVPRTSDEICLPYLFKAGGGYRLGDSFEFTYEGRSHRYVISGFSEETIFGSINWQVFRFLFSDDGFARLAAQLPEARRSMLLNVHMTDLALSPKLDDDFTKEFFDRNKDFTLGDTNYMFNAMDIVSAKAARTWMASLTSAVIIVLSALILLISLIVIRFRIHNSIEEGIVNIGALKAAGYTSGQVIGAHILQFGSICALAALVGAAGSYALLPAVSLVLEQQTALVWEQGFDPAISGATVLVLLVAVLAVTLVSTGRIRRLQPLEALRGGIPTHSFRRNRFALDRFAAPLSLALALKSALRSKGQLAMITLIVAVMGFTAVAGLSLHYNLGVNPQVFAKLVAGELPDAAFVARDQESTQALHDELAAKPDVRKVFYFDGFLALVGDEITYSVVAEDFTLLEGSLLYEGRHPLHDDEIALSASLAERLGARLGETVELERDDGEGGNGDDNRDGGDGSANGDEKESYLVTGLIQTFNNGGIACAMTVEGYQRIHPSYQPSQIYAYLDDPSTTAAFIEEVERGHKDSLHLSLNLQELATAQLSAYGAIFAAVTVVIGVVTMLVIIGVLYLVLRTAILRQRRELGIQKALGFTTFQLMNQLALCFLPAVTLGVALGAAAGVLGFNSVFLALTRTLGIMDASMPAPLGATLLVCAGILTLSYAASLLIALTIRRINPYRLISE